MYKNNLRTLSLYLLYFILIVASIYIFYKLITNNLLKIKIQENFLQPPPPGEVITLGDNHIMSTGNNSVASFKYNPQKKKYQPSYNLRNYNEETQDNYYFFNRRLSENKLIEMNDGDTINLFLDYFDDIYDVEKETLKPSLLKGILSFGYYVDHVGNGHHPHYFLTFNYLLSKLISFEIYPSTFDEEYEQVKKLCGFLCKKLNYSCVLCPKFDSNYIESYKEWMFFVLIKQKSTKIKGSTSTSENNPVHDIVRAGNDAFNGLQIITQSSKFKNSSISPVSPSQLLNEARPITNAILFYLGNSSNDITGITSINGITITDKGLQMIICDKTQISNNSSNTGLIRDETYLDSLSSVENYLNSYKKDISISYSENSSLNSIPKREDQETNEKSSAIVMQHAPWGYDINYQINTDTPVTCGNDSGYENKMGDNTYMTLNKGVKCMTSDYSWYWKDNGKTFGASSKTNISTEYFPKKGNNRCGRYIPFTFNNNNNIEIPSQHPKSGEYELGIDTTTGIVYYKSDNATKPKTLFTIGKYGLLAEDLASDYSWPDVELNNGTLKNGDVLGVNGGNNQYVMDRDKKMRFWFDIHGTFHVEVNLSRKRDYIDRHVTAFQQKFNEIFYSYQEDRFSKNNYLNVFNYSGTSLNNKAAIMLILMFSETIVSYSNNTNPVDTLLGKDAEEDEDLSLFYKKIGDNKWFKNKINNKNKGINSQDCKNWFKQSNVYEDTIDFGKDFTIPGTENNSQPISINQSGIINALDECSDNSNCYAISCQTNSNICKLWDEDGIKKNYVTTPTYTNNTSDIYYKGCPNEVDILVQSRFQYNNAMPFFKTGVIFQTGDSNDYSRGVEQAITREYIDMNDIDINLIKKYYIDQKCIKNWNDVFLSNDKQHMPDKEKINFILDKIKPYKELIEIYYSDQTNIPTFKKKLKDEIDIKILEEKYLKPKIEGTTKEVSTNLANNSTLANTSAKNVVETATATRARTATTATATTATATTAENFSNLNDDYNNDNDIMNKISDKIIKKIVYNIDDIEFTNKFDDYNNINFINNIILSIFLIILVIVFFNIKK